MVLCRPTSNTMTSKQITQHLQTLPNWSEQVETICRTYEFEGFLGSIAFVDTIAPLAQKANHHPDIDICFDQVTLTLTTHDEGGLSEKDFAMAGQCDEVFAKLAKPAK